MPNAPPNVVPFEVTLAVAVSDPCSVMTAALERRKPSVGSLKKEIDGAPAVPSANSAVMLPPLDVIPAAGFKKILLANVGILQRLMQRLDFAVAFEQRLLTDDNLRLHLLPLHFKLLPLEIELHALALRAREPIGERQAAPHDRATAVMLPPPVIAEEIRTRTHPNDEAVMWSASSAPPLKVLAAMDCICDQVPL